MSTPNTASDMDQLFDFGHASAPEESTPESSRPVSCSDKHRVGCPAYGQAGDEGCLCHAFDQDLNFLDIHEEAPAHDFNTDFSSWLPQYQKPAHPCDYCRSRSLECFIFNSTDGKSSGCSPCNALFRPCSFNSPENVLAAQRSRRHLDTLNIVAEDTERPFGGLTGKKPLRSLGYMGPIDDESTGHKPKKGAATARFPRAAVKILKDWLVEHIDHPYPTEGEKEMLKDQTGLSNSQISNWMANTRRRQKARPKRIVSPSIRPSIAPIDIPPGRTWDDLNPIERWKHSPPENEPAPMQAIVQNIEHFDFPKSASSSMSYNKEPSNDSTGSFSVFRAPSTTSLETGLTGVSSGSLGSMNSAYSHSSRHSLGSFSSLKTKERRRRRRMPTRNSMLDQDEAPRLFQCTFCTDRFKSKYDWSRHEKSLHLSLEKWICAPLGEIITCTATGRQKCVFCDELDPSKDHLKTHNHRACQEKGMEARTFYRKDHLRQHLRLMHGCKMIPSMDTWKAETQNIRSRCGFCAMIFTSWQDRNDHLAKEFRNGATMKDWKGCRGLDAHVAAHVTSAMPPYLISNESKSPFPFSATNSSSMKHPSIYLSQEDLEYLLPSTQYPPRLTNTMVDPTCPQHDPTTAKADPRVTCWEILTLRLGRYARKQIELYGAGSITDAQLQSEARRILYGEDDPWHQTSADNPEWLELFKQAHGIKDETTIPIVSQSHEILEDLGVRPQAELDKSFYLENFISCKNPDGDADTTGTVTRTCAYECSLAGSGRLHLSRMLNRSRDAVETLAPPLNPTCSSSLTAPLNFPLATAEFDDFALPNSNDNGAGGFCIGDDGEIRLLTPPERSSNSPRTSNFTLATSAPMPAKATDSSMAMDLASISETPAEGFPGLDPNFDAWNPLDASGSDLNTLTTTADMGILGGLAMTTAIESENMGGTLAAWDDSELAFDMDMDMDIDLGMATDLDLDIAGLGS